MPISYDMAEIILSEGIIFLVFVMTCASLARDRFTERRIQATYGMLIACSVFLQILFYLYGRDIILLLTLLPLTLYLPIAVSIYLLSGAGFFRTSVIWAAGFLVSFLLKMFYKILDVYSGPVIRVGKFNIQILAVIGLLIAAALLLFLVYRYLGRAFAECAGASEKIWMLLSFPILLMLLLFSYLISSVTKITVWILLFLTALSVFLVLLKILSSYAALGRMKEQEKAIEYQMQVQREEYEELCKKIEVGRIYRHDMRHHLAVLDELAVQGKLESIRSYLGELGGKLSDTERQVFCENPTVNAVLSSWVKRAKELHCEISVNICLPEEIPYDEIDICMVLANTLENAVNACQDIREVERRHILVSVAYRDETKLFIQVQNPCDKQVEFDRDGLPHSPGRPAQDMAEHGVGLRSIKAIVEKYGGFFLCECEEGIFRFRAALFFAEEEEQQLPEMRKERLLKRRVVALAVTAVAFAVIVCGMPMTRQGILEVPAWKKEEPFAEDRSRKLEWGDTSFVENVPKVGDQAVDKQIRDYTEQMREQFVWYVMRKYDGDVDMETDFRVVRDDERLFTLHFFTAINAGSTADYSRYLTVDKSTGEILTLSELFLDGSDYVSVISEEILRQMNEQVQAGKARYYLPGGGWLEETCFKEIDPEQGFYIDEDNRLVIVFDKYEVAPGSMGKPEFVIGVEVLQEILLVPSLLEE